MAATLRKRLLSCSFTCAALAAAAPAAAAPANAAEPPPKAKPAHAIQADLGLAVVGLAYEHLFAPRVAMQFEAQIFGTWFGPIVDLPNLRGLGGQLRPTFFLTEDGPRGLYVAPFLRIDRVTAEKDGASGSGVGYSTGVFAGYSFLFGERVNLRVGGGAQYMSYVVDVAPQKRVAFKTPFPALDLVLGYVF